jgi:hypothetical protein
MDTSTVAQARRDLAEAEAALAAAEERETVLNSFVSIGTVWTVTAHTVEFLQFVSYSVDSKLHGVFSTKEEAERYVEVTPKPSGREFLVTATPLFA